MKSLFPYFGGKSKIAGEVWRRFGKVKQYVEPFCGSAAVLFGAPEPAPLECIGDVNGLIINFWRAVKHQFENVAREADYPVSHLDLNARHKWLVDKKAALAESLNDPEWPGDARAAGWWLWGACCWIGDGWCAGRGITSQIPHTGDAGMGITSKIPHTGDTGMGITSKIPHTGDTGNGMLTSAGMNAHAALSLVSRRLERVRIFHCDWTRAVGRTFGGDGTAYFMDPPYEGFESIYSSTPTAKAVREWCIENERCKIALCGNEGDHPGLVERGWSAFEWKRGRGYRSNNSRAETIWFSPSCNK